MPGEYERARERLVREMEKERVIRTPSIARAFRSVPRECFVPPAAADAIYSDTTIPVAGADGTWLTTSSQPAMMAIMLEQLQVEPGHRVLEIGAGTGYNAAVLHWLAGAEGTVDSVEFEPEAATHAVEALRRAGIPVRVHAADGADGWPPSAPYDRILSTVAVWDIPSAWMRQCAPGGRIVAPLTVLGPDYSVALERVGEGEEGEEAGEGAAWVSLSLEPCAFVRFKGRAGHPDARLVLDSVEDPSLVFSAEPGYLPDLDTVRRWLSVGRGEPLEPFRARGDWDGFVLWMLQRMGPCRLVHAVSRTMALGWEGSAIGLWDDDGLSLVTASGRLERFGAGDTAGTLAASLHTWCRDGRPDLSHFRLHLTPGIDRPGPARLPRWEHTVRIDLRPEI